MKKSKLVTLLMLFCVTGTYAGEARSLEKNMKQKALIVVTSHSALGNTGKKTGYYLPEVSHPYFELAKAGVEVEIASPKGGRAPIDENSLDLSDPINREFWENPKLRAKLENTLALGSVKVADYQAILFAGGHGTMWDFPTDRSVQKVASAIYEAGGVVAAVCHGPAALVNVKLSNGNYLIEGKDVAGFSNSEEEAAKLTQVMPFLLETQLKDRGGKYSKSSDFTKHVVVSERLVTGQNPASALGVGQEIAKLLRSRK